MGWRPHHVYACTVTEFAAAWDGWAKIHCAPVDDDEMTLDEYDDLVRFVHEKYPERYT